MTEKPLLELVNAVQLSIGKLAFWGLVIFSMNREQAKACGIGRPPGIFGIKIYHHLKKKYIRKKKLTNQNFKKILVGHHHRSRRLG